MEELKLSRKPTRDYMSLSSTPWSLWDVLYTRRSNRRYVPFSLTGEMTDSLEELVRLSLDVREAPDRSIRVVTEPETVEAVRKGCYKGIPNKINLWLARNPASGFLVMAVSKDDLGKDRPQEISSASVAMEDCVLWLTEQGLGTCWMAGVNSGEIKKVLDFNWDRSVPVVVLVGRPKRKTRTPTYDNFASRAMSRKRKPLSQIAYIESMSAPYSPKQFGEEGFSASSSQGVRALLELLKRDRPDTGEGEKPPLDLVMEACFEAARVAPSGGNAQQWHFIAVRDAKKLEQLKSACGETGDWRAAIVGAGNSDRLYDRLLDKPFWMIDVPIALSHISLMALSAGSSAVLCMGDIDEEAVNRLVGLTDVVRTAGVVGIT